MAATDEGDARGGGQAREGWLKAFQAGEPSCMEACYREHFDAVSRAVSGIVQGADHETLVHEVFARLLSEEPLRCAFLGGSLGAWLRVVARNHAIDYARRRRLEVSFPEDEVLGDADAGARLERQIDARLTLERFRDLLPAKWRGVFDARFVAQHDQPTAARALRMHRTTLAYQEYRIRSLLRSFVLRGETK